MAMRRSVNTLNRRSRKAGLPPGSLVHTGEAAGTASIKVRKYDSRGVRTLPDFSGKNGEKLPEPQKHCVTWYHVQGVNDASLIETLGGKFKLHPLLLEDVMSTDQRPKVEDYGDHLFVVLRALHFESGRGLRQKQVALVLGRDYLISFEEGPTEGNFTGVIERLVDGRGRLLQEGADYLAYSLLDSVVDHYFLVLENISDEMESLEDRVLRGKEDLLSSIHALKRELISLRKSIWPLREALVFLDRQHSDLIDSDLSVFFRDIYDHTIHIVDTIESFRDMLSGLLDVHLSTISTRLNQVMKLLTVITTIFMPLTLITGIYGMNFDWMPLLHNSFGFAAAMGGMFLITIGMVFFFRRKGWL